MIRCNFCGLLISGEDSYCQYCGTPIHGNELVRCDECGALIPPNAPMCTSCGRPRSIYSVQYGTVANIDTGQAYYPKRKSNIWIYPMVSFFIAAIVSLGYLLLKDSFGNNKVREFTKVFAKAVKTNDTSTIYRLYPDAKLAESFAFSDDAGDAKIKKKGNIWKVTFSNGKSLTVAKDKVSKSFYIKESRGVFSFSPTVFDLATKTGWYDPKLNDKQNAERLADTNFTNWLSKRSKQYLKNAIKITMATSTKGPDQSSYDEYYSYGDTFCTVVVTNTSNLSIAGNEYVISAQEKWRRAIHGDVSDIPEKGKTKTITGKPIPPNGTVTYSWKGEGWYTGGDCCDYTEQYDFKLSAHISFTPQAEKAAQSHISYTGNEYSQYLAEKGK